MNGDLLASQTFVMAIVIMFLYFKIKVCVCVCVGGGDQTINWLVGCLSDMIVRLSVGCLSVRQSHTQMQTFGQAFRRTDGHTCTYRQKNARARACPSARY